MSAHSRFSIEFFGESTVSYLRLRLRLVHLKFQIDGQTDAPHSLANGGRERSMRSARWLSSSHLRCVCALSPRFSRNMRHRRQVPWSSSHPTPPLNRPMARWNIALNRKSTSERGQAVRGHFHSLAFVGSSGPVFIVPAHPFQVRQNEAPP